MKVQTHSLPDHYPDSDQFQLQYVLVNLESKQAQKVRREEILIVNAESFKEYHMSKGKWLK